MKFENYIKKLDRDLKKRYGKDYQNTDMYKLIMPKNHKYGTFARCYEHGYKNLKEYNEWQELVNIFYMDLSTLDKKV